MNINIILLFYINKKLRQIITSDSGRSSKPNLQQLAPSNQLSKEDLSLYLAVDLLQPSKVKMCYFHPIEIG